MALGVDGPDPGHVSVKEFVQHEGSVLADGDDPHRHVV